METEEISMVRKDIVRGLLDVENGEKTLEEALTIKIDNEKDAALYREIIKGVFRHRITLDYYIQQFLKKKNQKIHKPIRMILRMSFYQWIYLEKIPAHAIVNEGVELAKKFGHRGTAGFVNAILRKATAKRIDPSKLQFDRVLDTIHIKYSLPLDLTKYFIQAYGEEWTLDYAKNTLEIPDVHIRVNTNKRALEDLKKDFEKEGILCQELEGVESALRISQGNVFQTNAFKEGDFYVQDKAAMSVVDFMLEGLEDKSMTLLDVCGAPGGKSIAASFAKKSLSIKCCDVQKDKIKKIKENIKRLGIKTIKPCLRDGRHLERSEIKSYDLVLLDAPCSGYGLLKRKPEIKYNRTLKDVKNLVKLQEELINTSIKYLRDGGYFIYSTCTLTMEENELQIEDFLKRHKEFDLVDQRVLALNKESDGFKMFKLVKKCAR